MTEEELQSNNGFTLVETLVAISVLLISVVAPMTLAQQGIRSARIAQEQTTASYLAQDALEYIHNVRDTNRAEADDWLDGLGPCINSTCKIDVPAETITSCSGGSPACENLRKQESTNLFGYDSGWTETVFNRKVEIDQLTDYEVEVVVTMSWDTGLFEREFVVRNHLYDW